MSGEIDGHCLTLHHPFIVSLNVFTALFLLHLHFASLDMAISEPACDVHFLVLMHFIWSAKPPQLTSCHSGISWHQSISSRRTTSAASTSTPAAARKFNASMKTVVRAPCSQCKHKVMLLSKNKRTDMIILIANNFAFESMGEIYIEGYRWVWLGPLCDEWWESRTGTNLSGPL